MKKIIQIMKIVVVLLTIFLVKVSAKSSYAQQVSLHENNSSLLDVFKHIEQQTGYTFFYKWEQIENAQPITIQLMKVPLDVALSKILQGLDLEYSMDEKTVVIKQKPVPNAEKQALVILSGTVTDTAGHPIAQATLRVLKANLGVAANAQGQYIFANVPDNALIHVSSVGFESLDINIADLLSGKTIPSKTIKFKKVGDSYLSLDIILAVAQNALDDVEITAVNTGYQKIKPEQSTGAVSVITTKEYESRISTNFLDGLVNKLPGLMINNDVTFSSNGTSRSLFNIRGISTMSANQSPLIVVDGYPTELTLDMIDPNEIKSVTILKDAAAATVYGVRASNGVIVIERKQAVKGAPRFSFRATAGITPKENYNRYRWADDASSIVANYQKDLYSTSVNSSSWEQLATGNSAYQPHSQVYYILAQSLAKIITPYQAQTAFADLENYNNIDDYSRLFQRSAVTQTYNFNVSGGNDNALYYITANYTGDRNSKIKNTDSKLLLSARSTIKFSKLLSLELTTDYQEQFASHPPVPDITTINPYEHFQDVNGNPAAINSLSITPWYSDYLVSQGLYDERYYPLVDVDNISNKTHTINNRITANFYYKLGSGFDLSFGGIYETSRADMNYYASELSSEARGYVNSYVARNMDGTLQFNLPKGGFLRQQTGNTSSYTARAQLNYNKKIGDHSINAILGAEVRDLIEKSNLASYFGYNDETLLQQPVDFAGLTTGSVKGTFQLGSPLQEAGYDNYFDQQYNEDRFLSGYANVVYAYKDTYSLTGSIRIDQSNLFGTNPKYKYKPLWSLGAAWNIHKEDFMQQMDWMQQLKLRLAYGFNGNVAKMSLPQVIAEAALNTYTSPYSQSLSLVSYANSSLRWEQTTNFNAGLDYRIFKNISGTVDYYQKKSADLLGNSLIDPTIGASPTLINKATIRNRGLEVSLHADWIATEKFNWNTGLVLARNTSKVLNVYQQSDFDPQTLTSIGYVKNYPVGALFAYRDGGLDTAGYPLVKNSKGEKFRTNNNAAGNAMFDLMRSDTSGFVHYMGSSIPTINAGLSNRVDIGHFYIYAMVNYYGGFKVQVPRANPAALRPLKGAGNYWKTKGDELTTDVMGLAAYTSRNSNDAYNYSDSYVVDGDYLTLADLTLSYSLDKSRFIKKAGFTHFEIKAQASNLWTVGFNRYNYSSATQSFQKTYITPTYTLGIFTNL